MQVHQCVENKVLSASHVENILKLLPSIIKARYEEELNKSSPIKWTCIQMDLCGKSLRNWLKDFKPPKDSIFTQMKQTFIVQNLISGMTFLHDKEVIHRDLKPENIMFTS